MEEIHESPKLESNKTKPGGVSWMKSEAAVRTADLLAGAIAITLIFWWLQYSTDAICCGDYDGYYHTKWSRTLWEGMKQRTFPPEFPWLPLTTLNSKEYVDHHLLFHVIQIPFAEFSDPRKGAKVA